MTLLCKLDEIIKAGSKEYRNTADGIEQGIFIVYHNHEIYGYKNICPHQGLSLNWMPDRFLDNERTLIQCSNHDARFRIQDGECIAGPCIGERLTPVTISIIDDKIKLEGN